MGDKVKGLISGYIDEMEGRSGRKAPKPVTFSMRLSEREHAKLVWLAKNLDVPKTPLAEQLLKAAVDEAIEQYAGWAASEDPQGFLEESLGSIEKMERGSGVRDEPGPPPHERPGHRPHGRRGEGPPSPPHEGPPQPPHHGRP